MIRKIFIMLSVLWRCWLGAMKGIRPKKTDWWGAGMVLFWSEVQITCIWFSWCHCHPIMSASAKSSMSSVRFLRAGCPSWHPTNSVKALKAMSYYNVVTVLDFISLMCWENIFCHRKAKSYVPCLYYVSSSSSSLYELCSSTNLCSDVVFACLVTVISIFVPNTLYLVDLLLPVWLETKRL